MNAAAQTASHVLGPEAAVLESGSIVYVANDMAWEEMPAQAGDAQEPGGRRLDLIDVPPMLIPAPDMAVSAFADEVAHTEQYALALPQEDATVVPEALLPARAARDAEAPSPMLVAQVTPPANQTLQIGAGPAPSATIAPRLNPTGRPIVLTLPAKDGITYLGDVIVTITPDDRVEFSSQRLLEILRGVLDAQALETIMNLLTGRAVITPADLAPTGLTAEYNPQTLELNLGIPVTARAARTLAVAPTGGDPLGTFVPPAQFSGYLNTRGTIDYVHKGVDTGLQAPILFMDGALWFNGIVAESEAVWQPGFENGTDFQRLGSRLVFDDMDSVMRWTAGDLQTEGRGFQSAPEMAGLSLYRSYSVLEPQRSVRPAGDQAFQLARASTVEIRVNGQLVRRVRLDPGTYNLRDFPFSQGANDITVFIEDDTGAQQTLRFNMFFDQTQLASGLAEFGLFAGVKAPLREYGPDYQDDFIFSGYYRRGISENLTLGGNFQIDERSRLVGAEGVFGSVFGTFGFSAAASNIDVIGDGYALTLTFQRLIQRAGGGGDSFNAGYTTRSRRFAPIGVLPNNPYAHEFNVGYSHAFNDRLYTSLDGHWLEGRGFTEDLGTLRGSLGYRLTAEIGMSVDATYRSSGADEGVGAFVSLVWRMNPTSTVRADYTSRNNQARLGYQTLNGTGVGSYNINANIERSDDGAGLNGTGNYIANRAEIGVSHFTALDPDFGDITDQRTSLRVGTALAFADGAITIGRPVNQAFAIVKEHPTLDGADVIVQPTPFGYNASTGALGTALETNVTAYAPQNITVDAPTAPPGYDLGAGSFRVLPPYRAGYLLEVGSDYSVTAIGRLLTATGEPVALLAGRAVEVANPNREPIVVFTNAQGRFGASGLRPGQWRIEMPTQPATVYILNVPQDTVGALRAGDLRPSGTGN